MNDNTKKTTRLRRAKKCRALIVSSGKNRLSVHRTSKHIYAQVFSLQGDKVVASASTLEKEVQEDLGYTGNKSAAAIVGAKIAKRTIEAGVKSVAFDRSGFRFHGRIKALADAAREAGLIF